MIEIKNLLLDFNGHFKLSIDNLIIPKGEIFAVIGPNGAGKTTLLNTIALFEKPEKGIINVFGENILNLRDRISFRRKCSYVFPQPHLLNETVYYNILLPLKFRGVRAKGNPERVLDFFRIKHLKYKNASMLSNGERHRVALARAFVTDPELILFDEPFSGLDSLCKESIINDIKKTVQLCKTTIIFVTQDYNEVLALADEVAIMMDGVILQRGKPEEILTRPVSKKIADFVGIKTIVETEIVKKENNLCYVKTGGKTIEVVSDYNCGDRVYLCIRPEDVIISRYEEKNSARNHLQGKISYIERLVDRYQMSIDCGFELIAFITKNSFEELNLKIGEDVFVSFKATAIHLIKK